MEGYNFDARKQLLEYDDVLRKQREIMYEQRNYILEHEDVHDMVKGMFERVVSDTIAANLEVSHHEDKINYEGICESLSMLGMREEKHIEEEEIQGKDREGVVSFCMDKVYGSYEKKSNLCTNSSCRLKKMSCCVSWTATGSNISIR